MASSQSGTSAPWVASVSADATERLEETESTLLAHPWISGAAAAATLLLCTACIALKLCCSGRKAKRSAKAPRRNQDYEYVEDTELMEVSPLLQHDEEKPPESPAGGWRGWGPANGYGFLPNKSWAAVPQSPSRRSPGLTPPFLSPVPITAPVMLASPMSPQSSRQAASPPHSPPQGGYRAMRPMDVSRQAMPTQEVVQTQMIASPRLSLVSTTPLTTTVRQTVEPVSSPLGSILVSPRSNLRQDANCSPGSRMVEPSYGHRSFPPMIRSQR